MNATTIPDDSISDEFYSEADVSNKVAKATIELQSILRLTHCGRTARALLRVLRGAREIAIQEELSSKSLRHTDAAIKSLREVARFTLDATVGKLVLQTLEASQFLYLATTEEDDGETEYLGTAMKGTERQQATDPDLRHVLLATMGRSLKKRCRACQQRLPLRAFSKNSNNPDGRVQRCKPCERERVAKYDEVKKARRARDSQQAI